MSPVALPRRRAAWLFLQVSAAVLPALTAARLRFEMDKFGLDALEGMVFVSYAGPFALLWTLILGLRVIPSPAGSPPILSFRLRVALLFTSTALGLWLLQPLDLSVPLSAWWSLLFWLFGLAAPLGLLAHRCRDAGRSLLGSLAVLASCLSVATLVALLMAMTLELPALTMGVPVVVGGLVFAIGLGLLQPERSGVSFRRALCFLAALAFLAQGFVAFEVSQSSHEAGYVTGIVDIDRKGSRLVVRMERLSIPVEGFAEINLITGAVTEISRRTLDARYAGGIRVELRRSSLAVVLGSHRGQRLCHEEGGGVSCGEPLPGPGRYILVTHPRAAQALVTRANRTEVNDFETGMKWSYSEGEGKIRWPCFSDSGRLLFRVDRGTSPYAQLAMDLAPGTVAPPVGLPLGHEVQCLGASSVEPEVRFIRGRRRESRPSRIKGPGLPESGLDLGFSVLVSSWSDDGQVLGLLYERGWFHRFRLGEGFTEPILLGPTEPPVLNYAGNRLAHVVDRGSAGMEMFVRELPSGEPLSQFPVTVADIAWDDRGAVLMVQSWALTRFDPGTGETTVLFPLP